MANETEKKECKRCHEPKPLKDFVKSKVAKSGRLGYCLECWSEMVSHKGGRKKHKAKAKPGRKPGRPVGRPPGRKPGRSPVNGHEKVVVQAANDALKAANARKERFLVKAGEHKQAVEFTSEDKALRHAMVEKMKGRNVTIWRSCEFEMVLRIVGG